MGREGEGVRGGGENERERGKFMLLTTPTLYTMDNHNAMKISNKIAICCIE